MIVFMQQFERLFPLEDLWIPGPLVAIFRALSAFRPDANDLFAGVTASLPATPGLGSGASLYELGNDIRRLMPNINIFISRYHSICAAANVANATDATFQVDINGPRNLGSLFSQAVANNAVNTNTLQSAGASFAYGGSLLLWQNASRSTATNGIPAALNATIPDVINDTWTSALRFENNDHLWFAPVFALMAKYSQFWNGSVPISKILPTSSAAGALKLRSIAGTTLLANPVFVAATVAPAPVVAAHFQMRNQARLVHDGQIALRDVPDTHAMCGLTFALNCYDSNAHQTLARHGPFWELGPNVKSVHSAEVLPGTLQVISRDYHRDTRLEAHKQ